ncbi:hypothetical protein BG004_000899 [Podila humilis]|nr:hypothetical protein BG004_000899 [Podila humilis]
MPYHFPESAVLDSESIAASGGHGSPSSPVASITTTATSFTIPPRYFHQTTSLILESALIFAFIVTCLSFLLFSFARTRRPSIYGPRRFFVRQEQQADAIPSSFFGWISPLLFIERRVENCLIQQKKERGGGGQSAIEKEEQKYPIRHSLPTDNTGSKCQRLWKQVQTLSAAVENTRIVRKVRGATGAKSAASREGKGEGDNAAIPVNNAKPDTSSHLPTSTSPPTSPPPLPLPPTSPSPETDTNIAQEKIIAKIGLDHYLLVRFLKMLFTLSVGIAVAALVVLLPVYSIGQSGEDLLMSASEMVGKDVSFVIGGGWPARTRVEMLHIGNVTDNKRLWATVVFTAALSVLLQHLPPNLRSVAALKSTFATAPDGGVEYVYLVHDVSVLDKLVKRRQTVLDKLEEAEFRYMDAIARASVMVATTTLTMRSRSWIGELLDKTREFFGVGNRNVAPGTSNVAGMNGSASGVLACSPEDEEYVGPLKMYQLEEVPNLSFTDLSSSGLNAVGRSGRYPLSPPGMPGPPSTSVLQAVTSNTSVVTLRPLKWFQKPRRPRHYLGIPLLSSRVDSIRYYRGELCQLNKVIAREYAQQAKVMEIDQQQQKQQQQQRHQPDAVNNGQQAGQQGILEVSLQHRESQASLAPDGTQLKPLASAFILMRTRAGAKVAASADIAPDKIDVNGRVLGITPRDIDWRILGQTQSSTAYIVHRAVILVIGFILSIGCGLVVSSISSLAVHSDWERMSEQEVIQSAPSAAYWKQGILAPILLTTLMLGSSWIMNSKGCKVFIESVPFYELCQHWGRVSKIQGELLIQRYYFVFLVVNMALIHPIVSLSFSWQQSSRSVTSSPSAFLTHAIPSYSAFTFAYVLMSGLALPLLQLLQIPRLWATVPTLTLWSILGPLSWRKSTRHHHKRGTSTSAVGDATESGRTSTATSTASSRASTSAFDANFTPAPTQTPRQAFQIRQPPFFQLQSLYPHVVLLFLLSLTLIPLSPILFLLWIVVLFAMNLCYRYLVLQVVATKSQSGGLHYLQAINLLLFPTVACPPIVLTIYLFIRQAWVHAGFALVLSFAVLAMRVVIAIQFRKREEMMLARVEENHSQSSYHKLGYRSSTTTTTTTTTTLAGFPNTTTTMTTTTTSAAFATEHGSIVDLRHIRPGGNGAEQGHGLVSDMTSSESNYGASGVGTGDVSSTGRRNMQTRMPRPTTIIGQVRNSMFSSHSQSSIPSNRPKSVPVFDLERYEKEILGIGSNDKDPTQDESSFMVERSSTIHSQDANERGYTGGLVRANTIATSSASFDPTIGTTAASSDVDVFSNFLNDNYDNRSTLPPTTSILRSKAEEEAEEKEAKYREIVIALRRASSVASQRLPKNTTGGGSASSGTLNHPRRVRLVKSGEGLASIRESFSDTGHGSQQNVESKKYQGPYTNQSGKALFRASLPALSSNPPGVAAAAASPSSNALSQISMSSRLSGGSGGRGGAGSNGAPSLPMLLIHRESAVAAKEWSRVQNLYLNPVLQEAKDRVMFWLPSQTEQSFLGLSRETQGTAARFLAQCRHHHHQQQQQHQHHSMTGTTTMTTTSNSGGCSTVGRISSSSAAMMESSGISTSTLATPGGEPTSDPDSGRNVRRSQHLQCTCHLYQELMKAVADAVALADQEVRDLRTVGLTVWLDSRHVVWGEENEENGRLGDRLMVSSGPSSSTLILGGGAVGGAAGNNEGRNNNGESRSRTTTTSGGQLLVGDGLLSWLDEDTNGVAAGGYGNEMRTGQGAPGVIGGSMGVIIKRPIGSYGRMVGDGEEEGIAREWM